MRITVLGSSAAYPGAGRACSGFLIEHGSTRLLLDCGTGVLSNLQKFHELREISAVVISHMHADHFFDLIPYRYALKYGLDPWGDAQPLLYLPPGGRETLERVAAPFAENDRFFVDIFRVSEYAPAVPLRIGDLEARFAPVRHYVPSWAIRIQGPQKIVYTSDTGACPDLFSFSQDADVLLANVGRCLVPDRESLWGHLRPSEAGALAVEARVGTLILSHFWPACNRERCREEAKQQFTGPIRIAEEGLIHEMG